MLAATICLTLATQPAVAQPQPDAEAFAAVVADPLRTTTEGPPAGTFNVNQFLGANRFYDAGLTGQHVVMANVEAGYIWDGHQTLGHVEPIPTEFGVAGEVDRHATWVGMLMGGRPTDPQSTHQQGLAPDARLFSAAIASRWTNSSNSPRFTGGFNANFNGLGGLGPYRRAFETGLSDGRTADVINSSYNLGSTTAGNGGLDGLSLFIDAMASSHPRTLLTLSAGNTTPTGAGSNLVASPASAFNALTVASLGNLETRYDAPSFFSNSGPNEYVEPRTFVVSGVRSVIDLATPGENLAAAYYGGETGGNGTRLFGPAAGPEGGPDYYSSGLRGTSFAAPLAAGGAALLYDAAYVRFADNQDARDARVIKSVLMNSADKTLAWDNGQSPHPNGNGGVETIEALDRRVGAGRMNLDRAFDQFLQGTTDVAGKEHGDLGRVAEVGWDLGLVNEQETNDYRIQSPLSRGSRFTATLTWFRDLRTVGTTTTTNLSYDNLDLELWRLTDDLPTSLISTSHSLHNNTEHFSFPIPATGDYMLRVRWSGEHYDFVGDANSEDYALAWHGVAVPEPGSLALLLFVIACGSARKPRHRRIEVRLTTHLSTFSASASRMSCHGYRGPSHLAS